MKYRLKIEHKTADDGVFFSWMVRRKVWLGLCAIILCTAGIRVRLLNMPLERDEGEYAYTGQLILQGIAPFAQSYNMKMPGIYGAYALVEAVFGQTIRGIHTGLLIVNAATILLVFILCKRFLSPSAALFAAAVFAILSLGSSVLGFTANAEHFVIFFSVAGAVILIQACDNPSPSAMMFAGLLFGTAFIMKQHAAAFIAFAGLYLMSIELGRRPFIWQTCAVRAILFSAAVFVPFALICVTFLRCGVFDRFWFWTFRYASEYAMDIPFSKGLKNLQLHFTPIFISSILLWLTAGVGLIGIFRNTKPLRDRLFAAGFFVFSLFAASVGFYFRQHYFILLLPAAALLAGHGITFVHDILARFLPAKMGMAISALLAITGLYYTGYQQRQFLFFMSPADISRAIYWPNPFAESVKIGRFIREHSQNNDKIAVIGSEPQIYFYSNRHSATGYLYIYALTQNHPFAAKMQKEMMQEIEKAEPTFIIFVGVKLSWLDQYSSSNVSTITKLTQNYMSNKYKTIGVVDILDNRQVLYCWGSRASKYKPQSENVLFIYQRI